MMKFKLVIVFSVWSLATVANLSRAESSLPYSSGDQATLFADASELARTSHRRLIVIAGYNGCPSCRDLHDFMSKGRVSADVEKSFVVVHINISVRSGERTLAKIGVRPWGVPYLSVVDPEGNRRLGSFFPEDATLLSELKSYAPPQSPERKASHAQREQNPYPPDDIYGGGESLRE